MTKIDDLIETLVSDLKPVYPAALRLRLAGVLAVGLLGAGMCLLLSLAFRPHLHHVTEMAYWIKFCYTGLLMVATVVALDRVARPAGLIGDMVLVSGAALAVLALLAAVQLALSPASSFPGLIFGYSASFCPFLICAFGIPAFLANMWFLRRAAPTNLKLAGFIGGACAGAIGGWVYALACVENGIPFIAVWYTLGVLLSGLAGLAVGRFHLRW